VHEGNRPLESGWIEFIPVDGGLGDLRSAWIRQGGHFEVERLGLGPHVVRIVGAPIQIPGGLSLFGTFMSPIRREIKAKPDEPIDVDVLEEAVRYQAQATSPGSSQGSGSSPATVSESVSASIPASSPSSSNSPPAGDLR
jgi:hypothetical protein